MTKTIPAALAKNLTDVRKTVKAAKTKPARSKSRRVNDSIYGAAFKKQLVALNIRDGPVALRSPWQNGYAERLIGSIRRECLDHMIIRDEVHLRRVLKAYARYYNKTRTHLSLEKNSPAPRKRKAYGRVVSHPQLGGLHHEYARI